MKTTMFTTTANGAKTYPSTYSKVLDLFSKGGAYRARSESDIIALFKSAFYAETAVTLKVLCYLRDVRGGQGERRFFRVCLNWLADNHPQVVINN